MRIFVAEFVCGGGYADHPIDRIGSALRREGAAMLQAIVADLSDVAETVVPVDPRLAPELSQASRRVEIRPGTPLWGQWVSAARDCDVALVVAPESDGILAKAVATLRAGGVEVIAGSGDFLRVASDKVQTARLLHEAGVAHPRYLTPADQRFESALKSAQRFVVKPRDGCGTESIHRFETYQDAQQNLNDQTILQEWLPGQAISIACITTDSQQTFLPAVTQQIDWDTGQYLGGLGPLVEDQQRRATALASRAIFAMPPTARGFVGVDLVLGDRPSEDHVIEINPRLTTSYVGLRQMIHGNLAARLLDFESGPVSCCTVANSVRWNPAGKVRIDDSVVDRA